MSFNMTEDRVGLGDRRAPQGPLRAVPVRVPHWRAQSQGRRRRAGRRRIINTASESGLYGQAGQINYSAAKAGIVSMTIVLAREMKKYGVTANAVVPAGPHPHDRDGRRRGRVHERPGGRVDVGPGQHRAARRASSRATPPPTSPARCSWCAARTCT